MSQKTTRPCWNYSFDLNIQKLVESDLVPNENIYVSVYEEELVKVAKKYPVNIFRRSEKSAMSEGIPMTEIYEWWDKIPHKYVILTNACVPMLSIDTINSFTEAYLKENPSQLECLEL